MCQQPPSLTHYLCSFGPVWLKVSEATVAVAVLIAQFLCLSRHTKQQKDKRLKRKLAHSPVQVDSCNSARLEQQFLPRGSSLLSGPSVSGWKLGLEGKSSSCMMFPSVSWWQETAQKALDKEVKSKSRVLQAKQ